MRDMMVRGVDVLRAVAVEPIDLQNRGKLGARGIAGDAHGDGDDGAGLVGEGDQVLGEGRVQVCGALVEDGLVALPGQLLPG